jgi:peptidoglycan/LPS O-acetylase OafA/YrhL
MLSGMLLPMSVRKPLPVYYEGKFRRILWPLVVWTLALMAVTRGEPRNLFSMTYWLAGDYLWFLVLLTLSYVIGPLARYIHPAILTVVLLAAYLMTTTPHAWLDRLMWYAPFFFLGAALQRLALTGDPDGPGGPRLPASGMLIVPLLCVAALWSVITVAFLSPWDRGEIPFVMSALGAWALLLGARRWLRAAPLAWVGRHSLVFYVLHYPVMIIVVQVLDGVVRPTVAYILLIGVAGGVCYLVARFASGSALFVLPDLRKVFRRPIGP